MAILQEPNATFYHPLDDLTEALQAQAWTGIGESFGAGTVSNGLYGGSAAASAPPAYPTGVGATRLAFSAWIRSPGPAPFSGPPPQALRETERSTLTAMGVPASMLGGFT